LQRLDERELLDTLTLEHLVEFTNTLYDEWPMRKFDFFTGTTTKYEMSDSTESIVEDLRRSREELTTEAPLSLRSTDKGYRFTLKFPEGELQNLHNHLSHDSDPVNPLDIVSTDIPLAERMMYIALDTWFLQDHFAMQLQQARDHVERRIEDYLSQSPEHSHPEGQLMDS
jgi:hypothetical protein